MIRNPQVVMQIREFSTKGDFDDEQRIDFPSLPLIKPVAAPLPAEPAEWLAAGEWEGQRAVMTVNTGTLPCYWCARTCIPDIRCVGLTH